MGVVEDTLAHWRRQRSALLVRLSDLKSGTTLHSARPDVEWVDITSESIRQLKEEIGQLDRLLAQYEKSSDP